MRRDLLEALRQLLRRPGWTALAMLVLAVVEGGWRITARVAGFEPASGTPGAIAIVLVGAMALAGPAWRAAHVDPQRSLRAE
jgi:hypothetical protein